VKKTLTLVMVLLLTLSLLSACGGGDGSNSPGGGDNNTPSGDSNSSASQPAENDADDGNNTGGNSPKAVNDVIPASALISREEASAILGVELNTGENKPITTAFIDAVRYSSEDYLSLTVQLKQEALYDEETSPTKLKNGWAAHIESEHKRLIRQTEEEQEEFIMTAVPGIGDAAYLSDSTIMECWTIYVIYGEYIILVVVSPDIYGDPSSDAEIASYKEKVMEAGKLAADKLKAIIG